MEKKLCILLISVVLAVLAILACSFSVQGAVNATGTPDVTAPSTLSSPAETPYLLIILTVLLVAVYIALVILISKRPK